MGLKWHKALIPGSSPPGDCDMCKGRKLAPGLSKHLCPSVIGCTFLALDSTNEKFHSPQPEQASSPCPIPASVFLRNSYVAALTRGQMMQTGRARMYLYLWLQPVGSGAWPGLYSQVASEKQLSFLSSGVHWPEPSSNYSRQGLCLWPCNFMHLWDKY